MWEESVLLKIKREFTESEAVQQLLKVISGLETEIGVLKSERDEADDLAEKLRKLPTMTKKQWLQDEVFFDLKHEVDVLNRKNKEHKKKMEDWRNKYFTVLAKIDSSKNCHQNEGNGSFLALNTEGDTMYPSEGI